MTIAEIVARQRDYFLTDATKPVAFRTAALKRLQRGIVQHEANLLAALKQDLNKSDYEGYMTEVGLVLSELRFALKHIKKWTKPQKAPTPLTQFHARSFIIAEPYGVALIISPWNYPFQLSLEPLVGAIAAGNCAIVKPSEHAPHTSRVVAELIASCFPPQYITVIEGGQEQSEQLLTQKLDYIFFTGGIEVGKVVMEAASRNLTPVSLELGGKSPCIVDQTADLKIAARRLAFGKYLNAGQTCVAPDYLLVHHSVRTRFISFLKEALEDFFPDRNYANLPAIINDRHFDRLLGLIKDENILLGGRSDPQSRFIEPTVVGDVSPASPLMREEIMGPILPVMSFENLDEVIAIVRSMPQPLALYLFSSDRAAEKRILSSLSFGGGCINDTVIHLTSPHLGFGGVGDSGMGCYHGKYSFDTFTHYKSILKKSNWIDLPMRYHPYTASKSRLLRLFLK
jgi:aldehyde dehydrogenase (NAD+)